MKGGVFAFVGAIGVMAAASGVSAAEKPEGAAAMTGDLYSISIGGSRGVPLIAVNGGPGFDHRYMFAAPIWKDIAAHRQIVFYDQRGTGRSPGGTGKQLSVAGMVEDLEVLRRRLKVEKIDLVGHSWGGVLSMAYAVRYPQHVAHMILVGSGDAKPAENEFLFDKLYPEIVAEIPVDTSPAGQMGCVEVDAYDKMSYYDQRNNVPVAGDPVMFSSETCTTVMLDAIKLDLYPALAKLNVPTLVINGRFDANVAPSVAYRISKAIPDSKLVYFERSGHTPFVEEPEKFALVVERFLADKAD